ncbi:hypothetical protein BgiBS90_000450 [Biomphalaria glabrata]|nr:hypothetical protein BgiBS90_000450 [Biomphalaria glabrata]
MAPFPRSYTPLATTPATPSTVSANHRHQLQVPPPHPRASVTSCQVKLAGISCLHHYWPFGASLACTMSLDVQIASLFPVSLT